MIFKTNEPQLGGSIICPPKEMLISEGAQHFHTRSARKGGGVSEMAELPYSTRLLQKTDAGCQHLEMTQSAIIVLVI